MNENEINKEGVLTEDSIDLYRLIGSIFSQWKPILLISFLITLSFWLMSSALEKTYKSYAVLIPNQQDGFSSESSALASLSSIAGIGGNTDTKSVTAIEILKSTDFFEKFYSDSIFYNQLWQTENIDSESESHKDLFDSHERFLKKLEISHDVKKDIYKISVNHPIPEVAFEWISNIIYSLNNRMREIDESDSNNAITYLKEQLSKEKSQEVRKSIANGIEREYLKLTYAKTDEEYVFKIIDSPRISNKHSYPQTIYFIVAGALIGLLSSLLSIIILDSRKKMLSLSFPRLIRIVGKE